MFPKPRLWFSPFSMLVSEAFLLFSVLSRTPFYCIQEKPWFARKPDHTFAPRQWSDCIFLSSLMQVVNPAASKALPCLFDTFLLLRIAFCRFSTPLLHHLPSFSALPRYAL